MADPHGYRPAPGAIPESPGVYRFRDQRGRVIYVGKAKSLRQRLNSYFADFATLHPRTQAMLTTAAGVDWTVVGTEVEAFQLEYSWIKEFDPRFNIRYRDDKSYPYLAVTMSEEYPRVMVMRGARRKGTKYFGPYSHAFGLHHVHHDELHVRIRQRRIKGGIGKAVDVVEIINPLRNRPTLHIDGETVDGERQPFFLQRRNDRAHARDLDLWRNG